MYGPTEGTGGATIKKLLPGVPVTIGAPNPSSRIYILDRNQSLVPPGVAGEIYLAGVQVARGYIGRPDETSNRFFPDHVLGEMGERMYKTGDRGYWNAEGEIICIGRNDRQIKLRGFRLDLNDLEIRIAQAIPGLTAVAVAQREDYLVAMIQPSSLDVGHVKSKIADILQVYAMPRVIAAVDEFPLTPIGKIDYKRVAEIVKPKVTKSPPKQSISASETMLISAWREPYSWPQMLPSTVIPISPTLEALRSLSCFWPVDLASCSGTRYHTERLLRRRRYGSSHRRLMSSKAPKMRLALHLFIRRPH